MSKKIMKKWLNVYNTKGTIVTQTKVIAQKSG